MKYYAKLSANDDSVITIYRWNSSESAYAQDVWNKAENTWKETELLFEYLASGEPTIEEISENQAKSLFPAAF